jgi:hypothetical protein
MAEYNQSCHMPAFSERGPAYVKDGIEIRCPGPSPFKKLFLVLIQEHMPQPGMLMEIACADCAKWARDHGSPGARRFLHYYDTSGKCVSNKVTV